MIAEVNDPHTILEGKVERLAARYNDMMLHESETTFFLMSETRCNPEALLKTVKLYQVLMESVLVGNMNQLSNRALFPDFQSSFA